MRFALENGLLSPSLTAEYRLDEISPLPKASMNTTFHYSKELQQTLLGKKLLLDEIPVPVTLIQKHYQNGYVMYHHGVIEKNGAYQCQRCGNKKPHLFYRYFCARCKEDCAYCRNCIMMGRVSQCTPLISWIGPTIPFSVSEPLMWTGSLSIPQQHASHFLVESLREKRSALIWAVTGAGKTEILFAGIHHTLSAGKRVCIAAPRTDVVLELSPRLKKVFPTVPIATLYEGTEDRNFYAPLVIATTHQLLRFTNAFDVMIVDEVDAFPYTVDESLQRAVGVACKEESSCVYLTATPSKLWQREVKHGKRNAVIIPARYHGHSLPVPVFTWCGYSKKSFEKGRLPKRVLRWIDKHLNQRPMLLFVPHIETLYVVTEILKKIDGRIEGVHAGDKDRKEKVMKFRQQEIPLLVTTTILERGVTIENVQVAVLGAEDKVFTESALVQIAGRAGRSAQFPDGEVVFFHSGKSDGMVEAKKQIEQMNQDAKKKGLIQ